MALHIKPYRDGNKCAAIETGDHHDDTALDIFLQNTSDTELVCTFMCVCKAWKSTVEQMEDNKMHLELSILCSSSDDDHSKARHQLEWFGRYHRFVTSLDINIGCCEQTEQQWALSALCIALKLPAVRLDSLSLMFDADDSGVLQSLVPLRTSLTSLSYDGPADYSSRSRVPSTLQCLTGLRQLNLSGYYRDLQLQQLSNLQAMTIQVPVGEIVHRGVVIWIGSWGLPEQLQCLVYGHERLTARCIDWSVLKHLTSLELTAYGDCLPDLLDADFTCLQKLWLDLDLTDLADLEEKQMSWSKLQSVPHVQLSLAYDSSKECDLLLSTLSVLTGLTHLRCNTCDLVADDDAGFTIWKHLSMLTMLPSLEIADIHPSWVVNGVSGLLNMTSLTRLTLPRGMDDTVSSAVAVCTTLERLTWLKSLCLSSYDRTWLVAVSKLTNLTSLSLLGGTRKDAEWASAFFTNHQGLRNFYCRHLSPQEVAHVLHDDTVV